MGGTETLIAFAALASTAYSAQQASKKPDMPKLPGSVTKPEKLPDQAGLDAQRKRRAAKAQGVGSTILTGPLGEIGGAPSAAKTLLGQ